MSFINATETDRQILFEYANNARWEKRQTWPQFMCKAVPTRREVSDSFPGNFRRGRIDKLTAQLIADWLRGEFPDDYQEMLERLGSPYVQGP